MRGLTRSSGPITALELAYMAVALRDRNLVHLDEDVAREAGFPGPIAHGTFAIGHLGAVAQEAAGTGTVRVLQVSLRAPVLRGATLAVSATQEPADGDGGQRLALSATSGELVVASGYAMLSEEADR